MKDRNTTPQSTEMAMAFMDRWRVPRSAWEDMLKIMERAAVEDRRATSAVVFGLLEEARMRLNQTKSRLRRLDEVDGLGADPILMAVGDTVDRLTRELEAK